MLGFKTTLTPLGFVLNLTFTMEPLSVSTAGAGLVATAVKLAPLLYNLSQAFKDAPRRAQAAASEMADITVVVEQLQRYFDGRALAPKQRLSLITVEQITATLTNCVMSYSELDALIKSLHVDAGLTGWKRVLWVTKQGEVDRIIVRLQSP